MFDRKAIRCTFINGGHEITINKYEYLKSVFTVEEVDMLIKLINRLLKTKTDTSISNCTLYANGASTSPRHKLKTFLQTNKIHKTSKMEGTDSILLSRTLLKEYLKQIDGMKTKTVYFVKPEYIKPLINKSITLRMNRTEINTSKWLESQHNVMLHVDSPIISKCNTETVCMLYNNISQELIISVLIYIHNNPNVKVLFDEDLFSEINKEGVELDDQMEATITEMLLSKNPGDVTVGIEILSNVILTPISIIRVAIMLNFVNGLGVPLKKQVQTNSNIKTLINTLKIKHKLDVYSDSKDFLKSLGQYSSNGDDTLKIIERAILTHVNQHFQLTNKVISLTFQNQ